MVVLYLYVYEWGMGNGKLVGDCPKKTTNEEGGGQLDILVENDRWRYLSAPLQTTKLPMQNPIIFERYVNKKKPWSWTSLPLTTPHHIYPFQPINIYNTKHVFYSNLTKFTVTFGVPNIQNIHTNPNLLPFLFFLFFFIFLFFLFLYYIIIILILYFLVSVSPYSYRKI